MLSDHHFCFRARGRTVWSDCDVRSLLVVIQEKPFCCYKNHFYRPFRFGHLIFLDPFSNSLQTYVGRIRFFTIVRAFCSRNMACATLKRSLDFEPPMCRPTKRQRCTPMSISPSSSPPNSSRSEYVSPHFGGDVVPKITAGKSIDLGFTYLNI